MTGIRKNIWKHLTDPIFRREYAAVHAKSGVAYQIKAMRESRGWSQTELAEKSGKTQSNIARMENPDYGKFSVQTLLEIAGAYDVWLSVQFVSFSEGLRRTNDNSSKALDAVSFDQDMNGQMSVTHPSTVNNMDARIFLYAEAEDTESPNRGIFNFNKPPKEQHVSVGGGSMILLPPIDHNDLVKTDAMHARFNQAVAHQLP